MEREYVLFHGSHENFDEFDLNLIDSEKIANNGAGGDIFGHYFLGYNKSKINTEKDVLSVKSLLKNNLYNYIKKQGQYSDGFIYQINFILDDNLFLNGKEISITNEELKFIGEILKVNIPDNFLEQFILKVHQANDIKLYKLFCNNVGNIKSAKAFQQIEKFGIKNMSDFGTMIIFDDSKIQINHKKYINFNDDSKNEIIF